MRYKIVKDFLTEEECTQLIDLARNRLYQSSGWSVEKGQNTVTDYRTSYQCFLQRGENETVQRIEKRIADLTRLPQTNGEGLQVCRYTKMQHYKKHFDYFDPAFLGNQSVLDRGGQRVCTVLCYLNNLGDGDGGDTHFTELGLKIKPVRGTAIWWWNVDEQGNVDRTSMHEGMDVLRDGIEKWVCNKWIRQNEFV